MVHIIVIIKKSKPGSVLLCLSKENVIRMSTTLLSLGAVTTSGEDFQAEPWGWFVAGIR